MEKDMEKLYPLEDAIDRAIKDLPKDFKILEFIMKNREEVKAMCLFEYDEERHMRQEREEGIEIGMKKGMEKGMKKGREEGREESMLEMVRDGFLPIEEAAKRLGITADEVKTKLKDNQATELKKTEKRYTCWKMQQIGQ